MTRKFLQMGFTPVPVAARTTRAAGPRRKSDPEKAKSAAIFYERWKAAESDETYASAEAAWKRRYG